MEIAGIVSAAIIVVIAIIVVSAVCIKRKESGADVSAQDKKKSAKKPASPDTAQAVAKSPEPAASEAEAETAAAEQNAESSVEPKTETVGNGDEVESSDEEPVDDGKDDEVSRVMPIEENGKTRFIVIKYSRSFLAKLIQSDERTKHYYSELKNKLMLYGGVKSRIAWKYETFRKGRKTLAKLRLRGKTLSLCLAMDADKYVGTEYRVESLAEIKSYATTPCMYRIKNNRRLAYAKELIEELATKNGLIETTNTNSEYIDYAAQYPYAETDALIERKLIKVLSDKDAKSGNKLKPTEIREEVAATEVDKIMSDEVAASLIERSEGKTDKTRQAIINIDTLSQYFESGEAVTLAEIKKRVKGFNKKTTYIKVLARGTLNKQLIVEADNFSLQAVKMIVLTGGTAIRKR